GTKVPHSKAGSAATRGLTRVLSAVSRWLRFVLSSQRNRINPEAACNCHWIRTAEGSPDRHFHEPRCGSCGKGEVHSMPWTRPYGTIFRNVEAGSASGVDHPQPGPAVGGKSHRTDIGAQEIRLIWKHANQLIDGLVFFVAAQGKLQAQAARTVLSRIVAKVQKNIMGRRIAPVKPCVERCLLKVAVENSI